MNLIRRIMLADALSQFIVTHPIEAGTVHLWWAQLPHLPFPVEVAMLTATEQIRVEAFKRELIARRFIQAHVTLRYLLSAYLNKSLECIEYTYTKQGKPALLESINPNQLTFNLSHSHDALLIAIARSQSIGVDIESIEAKTAFLEIAKRFFSESESAELVLSQRVKEDFYRLWTAKEAIMKASGLGITAGLDTFTVPFTLNPPWQVAWQDKLWYTLAPVSLFANHCAAIASDQEIKHQISCVLNASGFIPNINM